MLVGIVRVALSRPYTFVVMALLLMLLGPLAARRTPTDIFPDIRIPVIAIAWQYTGMAPDEMAGRVTTVFQRALTTTVNDIEHIEANSYPGIGIVKVFFQPGVERRGRQRAGHRHLADGDPADAARMHAAADPELQRIDRPDPATRAVGTGRCPSSSCSISASSACRPPLARRVPGAAIPWPYGGKQRQVQVDLDPAGAAGHVACPRRTSPTRWRPRTSSFRSARRRSAACEYALQLNSAPSRIGDLGRSAGQGRQRRHDLHPRRGPGARRQRAADRHRACRRRPVRAHVGAEDRQRLDAGDRRWRARQARRAAGVAAGRT
jgi:hypothetical protein